MEKIQSEKTAISRKVFGKPYKKIIELGSLEGANVLDFGCGRGQEIEMLKEQYSCNVAKYDPYYFNDKTALNGQYDIIINNYVLNVIDSVEGRIQALKEIYNCGVNGTDLFISVRGVKDIESIKNKTPFKDGYITSKNTFQKGFTGFELIDLINDSFDYYQGLKVLIDDNYTVMIKVTL